MKQNELQGLKKALLEELAELRNSAENGDEVSEIVELDQSRQGRLSRMDALQGQAMSIAAKQRRAVLMKKITAALRRLEEGEFGYCDNCGKEIALGRLKIDPAADRCIGCAEKSESK